MLYKKHQQQHQTTEPWFYGWSYWINNSPCYQLLFRPAWSGEGELEQLWAGAAPSADSSPVVLCSSRDLPGLYLNPGSSKREPAFCLIMSHLTCTNVFKTSLHKRAQERRRVQGITERARPGMLSCRTEPVHTHEKETPEILWPKARSKRKHYYMLRKMRFGFCI